jgi:hypothetical protein
LLRRWDGSSRIHRHRLGCIPGGAPQRFHNVSFLSPPAVYPACGIPRLRYTPPAVYPACGIPRLRYSDLGAMPPPVSKATPAGIARRVESTHLAHATAGGKVDGYPACTEIPSQVARRVPSHQPRAGAPSPVLSRGLSFSVGPRLLCHSSFSGRPLIKCALVALAFPFSQCCPCSLCKTGSLVCGMVG